MIIIDNVELSKNPVQVGEALILKITLHEEMAMWSDVKTKTWTNVLNRTWNQIKRKIL